MKKIFFLSTLEIVPWGGSEQLWTDLALQQLKNGNQVLTSTLQWGETPAKLKQIAKAGGKLVFRPNFHIRMGTIDWMSNKMHLNNWKQEVEQFDADTIFISQGGAFDYALGRNARWIMSLNKPYTVLCSFCPEHMLLSDDERRLFMKFFAKAQKVCFLSNRNKQVAEKALLTTLDNAVVLKSPIRPMELPASYPKDDVYRMATAARMDILVKGYDILVETFAQPQWRDRSYEVNIYGSGEGKTYLEDMITYYRLEDKLHLRGFSESMAKIWEENQLLLMPSRGEGTPLALIETSYCGRAAVVTDVGGNADVTEHGYNGFVAEAATVRSFGKAMEEAWQNRHLWQDMGERARKRILQTHSVATSDDIDGLI